MSTSHNAGANGLTQEGTGAGRHDGRAPGDLRPVSFELHPQQFAEGSTLVRFGNTQVLCAASVLGDVPRWLRIQPTISLSSSDTKNMRS